MAQLTADDVVLKAFQTTKFREGYDQEEVDDFLDEVAESMRALAAENQELKNQLAAAEARVAELERAGQSSRTAPEGSAGLPPQPPASPPSPSPTGFGSAIGGPGLPGGPGPLGGPGLPGSQGAPGGPGGLGSAGLSPNPGGGLPGGPGGASEPIGGPVVSPPANQGDGDQSEAATATGMLALANKLHEQYVRAGQEEGDQMIAEAKAQAASIVRDAEETATRTKARLEQERAELEKEIESLRIFERDYRTRLRTYLKNLLTDIDGAASPGGADALSGR